MEYEVVLTSQAQLDFRKITHYLLYEFKSEQAAIGVTDDMEKTIERPQIIPIDPIRIIIYPISRLM